MNPTLVKVCVFVVGLVLGGAVVFGITKLTDNSSSAGGSDSSTNGTRTTDTLKFVIAVSRHGNKVMSVDYPLDPYPFNDTQYWGYAAGQLTPRGRLQEYKLGVKLRSLYNGFLNTTFFTEDVFACTDLYERTMMSGELVMAGLFPPQGWQVWNQNVNWQPIPLYTNSSDHSKTIGSCPKAETEREDAYTAFLEEDAANITELIDMVYNETGEVVDSVGLSAMYEKLLSEETEGYDIPSWTSSVYPDLLADFFGKKTLAFAAGSEEFTRLYVGNLLEDMIDTLRNKSEGTLGERKISYYSAHDYTLLNLQVALGVANSSIVKIVKTGSALVMELHQSPTTSEYWLQVLYIDGSSLDSHPATFPLPDCGNTCYLDSLVNYTQRFVNLNYEEECQLNTSSVTIQANSF